MEETLRRSFSPVNSASCEASRFPETDPQMRRLAQEIITDQQSEIELSEALGTLAALGPVARNSFRLARRSTGMIYADSRSSVNV